MKNSWYDTSNKHTHVEKKYSTQQKNNLCKMIMKFGENFAHDIRAVGSDCIMRCCCFQGSNRFR